MHPTPYDHRLVRAATNHLTAVVNAENGEEADRRISQFLDRAVKSPAQCDAAFAAVQALRDMDVFEACEAAYLFSSIWDVWREATTEDDPVLEAIYATMRPLVERTDRTREEDEAQDQRVLEQAGRRYDELEAEFYSSRGETALGTIRLERQDELHTLVAHGSIRLIDDREDPDASFSFKPDPKKAALIAERLIALAATEHSREAFPALASFFKSQQWNDPASVIAAVQSVRELGIISFEESLGLIDSEVRSLASARGEYDRTYARWQRDMEAIEQANGRRPGSGFSPDAAPIEYEILERATQRLFRGFQAVYLRRFGEHRLANLLMEDPAEYERIRQEVSVGGWVLG